MEYALSTCMKMDIQRILTSHLCDYAKELHVHQWACSQENQVPALLWNIRHQENTFKLYLK